MFDLVVWELQEKRGMKRSSYSCAAPTKAKKRPASLCFYTIWIKLTEKRNNIICATAVKLQIQCWHEIVNARKGANSLGGMSQD